MSKAVSKEILELDEMEAREWLDSLDYVINRRGPERARELLAQLGVYAQRAGVKIPFTANTPYINTIPVGRQPVYPGSREIERRIKSLVRWNALAMVVRANREESGIGGHISTYASAATLFEVGFNHFFRARNANHGGTSSTSKAMPRREFTRGPFWKVASRRSICATSGAS
jgi:pyruvate dehydrogenase E1 component